MKRKSIEIACDEERQGKCFDIVIAGLHKFCDIYCGLSKSLANLENVQNEKKKINWQIS